MRDANPGGKYTKEIKGGKDYMKMNTTNVFATSSRMQ